MGGAYRNHINMTNMHMSGAYRNQINTLEVTQRKQARSQDFVMERGGESKKMIIGSKLDNLGINDRYIYSYGYTTMP